MEENIVKSSQKIILLVDDDQFITIAYKDGLESAGYSVLVATDGKEALNILKTVKPDVVLLELIIPVLNGFELLNLMKKDKNFSKIPVIVLTNLSQDSDKEEATSDGAIDFLVKADVSLKDLVTRINLLLNSKI